MPRLNIDELDDALVYERDEGFGGGMDAYTRSTLLQPGQFQYGLNGYVSNDFEFTTRAGANRLGTDASGGLRTQGLLYFDTPNYQQLIRVSNRAFQYWDGAAWNNMAGFQATDAVVDVVLEQGVDKVLISDGVQNLQLWNGTTFTDCGNIPGGGASPPVGAKILLWHANRMWAAGFSGTGAAGYERDAVWGSALLSFGQGDWDSTGRNFRIGSGDGEPIVGLASLSSSYSKGFAMAVLKSNSIWIVNTDPTAQVANFTAAIGPEQMSDGVGCVGKRAFCVFGNDLLFVSPDKSIRSMARMEAAQGQYFVSPALSLPIQPYVDRINWAQASKIAVLKYRELALFAVPLDAATENNTVFVWNGRLQRWAGIWQGWTPTCWAMSRFNTVQRLNFGDTLGSTKQWQDFQDASADSTYLDDGVAIPTTLYTRSYLFQEPLNPKDAFHADATFSLSNCQQLTFTLSADDQDVFTWSAPVSAPAPVLPQVLPFNLLSPANIEARKGLRGNPAFIESFLKLSSTSGWWSLRSLSLSAFLNSLLNQ